MTPAERYRYNPTHRAKVLAAAKKYHQAQSVDPQYRRLTHLRKRIYSLRQKLEHWLPKIEKWERQLLKDTKERDEIVAQRRKRATEARPGS